MDVPRRVPAPARCALCRRRRPALACAASASPPPAAAAAFLRDGKAQYATGERMAALKSFEAGLAALAGGGGASLADADPAVRRELLFSAGACYAASGDIENAWQFLRDAIDLGLDYTSAEAGATPGLLAMELSAQMRIQLRKYAAGSVRSSGTAAKEAFAASRLRQAGGAGGSTLGAGARRSVAFDDLDLSGDTDEGFGSIAARVVALLALASLATAVLFYAGLPFLR